MSYNPIVIHAKDIYGSPHFDTVKNEYNGVMFEQNAFTSSIAQCKISINLDYASPYASFLKNTDYSDVTSSTKYDSSSGITTYFVGFNMLVTLPDNMFLLNNLAVSTENNVGNDTDGYITQISRILNPDDGDGDFAFGTTTSSELGSYGGCKYTRISYNTIRMYFVIGYKKTTNSGATIVSISKLRNVILYATEQTSDTVTVGTAEFTSLESNELMRSDTTAYRLPYNKVSFRNSTGVVYTTVNVKSNLTILVTVAGGTQYTFTINSGNNISNETIGYVYGYTIDSVSPQSDTEYIYFATNESQTAIGTFISNNIISNYQNGKRTMQSLQIVYGKYYYSDGTAYNNGLKSILSVGDIVKPMKIRNGIEVPMSINTDGTAKLFEITSSEFDSYNVPKVYLNIVEKTT